MDKEDERFFEQEIENLRKAKNTEEKLDKVEEEKVQEEKKLDKVEEEKVQEEPKVEIEENEEDIETNQALQKIVKTITENVRKGIEKNFIMKELEEIKKVVLDLFKRKPPEIQKIVGKVETEFPEVQKIEGQVEVKNLPKKQKIEDERIVERIERLEKAIRSLKFPKPIKEVTIKNVSEFPKSPNVVKISEMPTDELKKIIEVLKTNKIDLNELVDFFSKNPDYYINVRLTDGKEWYRALTEIITGVSEGTKIVSLKDSKNNLINPATEDGNLSKIPGLAIPIHDFIALSYEEGNLIQVVYKQGGSNGTIVATLSLSYDTNGNLISITKTT